MKTRKVIVGVLLSVLVGLPCVAAASVYQHQLLSGWMLQPKVWTNDRLQVLWSAPPYDTLVLHDGGQKILTTRCKAGSAALNERGMVAWIETDGQVYLFDGAVTRKISPATARGWNLDLNKWGQVVWDASDELEGRHIYFYNGVQTVRLTSSGGNSAPKISDKGQIAWLHVDVIDGQVSDTEIFYFNGKKTKQLTDNALQEDYLRMAKNGNVTWLAYDPSGAEDSEVFLYDRKRVTQLTDNAFDDHSVVVSAKGAAWWLGRSGGVTDIFTFSKGSLWQVTATAYEETFPYYLPQYPNFAHVSKTGYFAWMAADWGQWPWDIFFYDGVNVLRLTDDDTFDMNPVVSDNGFVAWTHHAGPYNQSGELHLYDKANIRAITTNRPAEKSDIPLAVTVRGEIIYVERNSDTSEERVWLAIPE